MGFMITLICVYINTFEVFNWSAANLWGIFLVALPNTCYIANLMLANNICDLEEDENNKRYTLVHYLGKASSFEIIRRIKYNSNVSHFVSCRFRINPANNVTHAFNFTFCTETNPSLTEGTSEE